MVPSPWIATKRHANNIVEAMIDEHADSSKPRFIATGWTAGDAEETAISGVVLDNTDRPVPGVTVRDRDTAQADQTNAKGSSASPNVPVGTVSRDRRRARPPRVRGRGPSSSSSERSSPAARTTMGRPLFLLPIDVGGGL